MRSFLLSVLFGLRLINAFGDIQPPAGIPSYVTKYAPLLYLDQNELYLPSDIQSQLLHTFPALNYTSLSTVPLTLSNLSTLNTLGNCTSFTSCNVYLTSQDNVAANPEWLYGVLPDPSTGETRDARSCAVIMNEHDGVVDVFYMYFYAFNLGETVLGQILGDHVGDWEHSMVRFINGTPVSVWLSQHDYGQAFTYPSLLFSHNTTRPLIYSALGTHANFAVPGTHTRLISTVSINDFTSPGPIWDPIASALFYTYNSSSHTFSSETDPVDWLGYYGRWGDEQYPDSDPRQVNFYNLNITWKYESGPTGPWDKQLLRKDICPTAAGRNCTTLSVLPASSGSSIPVTVTRTMISSSMTSSVGVSTTSSGTGVVTSVSASASASASAKSGAVKVRGNGSEHGLLWWFGLAAGIGLILVL